MQSYIKIIDTLNKGLRYFAAILLAVMSALIVYQVLARILGQYIDMELPRWTEELARYLMIWLVFIGASLAVRYAALIGMEAIAERLPVKPQKGLRIVVLLVSKVFYVVLIIYGIEMLGHVSTQLSPGLKMPMAFVYAAIPAGGLFMLLNSFAVLFETMRGGASREFFKGAE
ncbi:TRAP transporter small permease [Brevibacillus humidisoli]|uniref:TRAP transporter small permease n=1 Tax=Brevibacillus humidisoli TaxID=2895522 RepID=UPI001E63D37E|nr:TRAP transporter small permease [Brevibacillus humidisoli]UFJ41408.1 TRAP transporter small permease [Brevibacillus humidisoli]